MLVLLLVPLVVEVLYAVLLAVLFVKPVLLVSEVLAVVLVCLLVFVNTIACPNSGSINIAVLFLNDVEKQVLVFQAVFVLLLVLVL